MDPDFSLVLSKVINDNMESAKEEILKKTLKEASKMFDKIKKSNISSSQFQSSNVIHARVTCDGCLTTPIVGNRYKCTVCDDFDYCEACEERNAETHKHPFLKIRKPEVAPVKIMCAIRDDMDEYVSVNKNDLKCSRNDYQMVDVDVSNKPNYVKHIDINCDIPQKEEVAEINKQREDESEKGFFDKVKTTFTGGVKETKKNIVLLEDMIKTNINNLINPEDEEKKKI